MINLLISLILISGTFNVDALEKEISGGDFIDQDGWISNEGHQITLDFDTINVSYTYSI